MNKFEVVSRFSEEEINLPKRATANAAGYDFEVAEDTLIPSYERQMEKLKVYQAFRDAPLTLDEFARETKALKIKPTLVPTGIKCQLNDNKYLEISVRSSLPLKHWLILANGVGIIDADYYNNPDNEGEIYFQLINLAPFDIQLKKGDRIGQGIIKCYGLVEGDAYNQGKIRTGGFGSTSKKLYPDFIDVNPTTAPYAEYFDGSRL